MILVDCRTPRRFAVFASLSTVRSRSTGNSNEADTASVTTPSDSPSPSSPANNRLQGNRSSSGTVTSRPRGTRLLWGGGQTVDTYVIELPSYHP